MSRSETQPRIGIGIPSVLMVLVVLAMAALCMLSFSSASSTESMTRRNAEVSTGYYAMAASVQDKLSQLDEALLARTELPAAEKIKDMTIEGISFSQQDDQVFFTLVVQNENNMSICVEGLVLDGAGARYRLLSHRTQPVAAPEDAPYLELMGGEQP